MANSYVTYTGDGATTSYSVPFPYLAQSHVNVLINGVATNDFTWITDSTIQLDTPTTDIIRIERVTPTDPLVDFTDGSVLTETQLDSATIQSLYVAEETNDSVEDVMSPAGTVTYPGDGVNFNARNKRIVNIANPTNPQDAATKYYIDVTSSQVATNAAAAATSATNAANSATSAASSASTATTKATQASTSATNAANSATAAGTSATNASTSASNAAASATSASNSATTATTKAGEASTSASQAASSATNAQASATAAAGSESSVAADASAAQTAASDALASKNAAASSATSASNSASTATTKASQASTSETNASGSATNAANSATAAANSATAASNSAAAALSSENAAASSELAAATSATSASSDASAAATSAAEAVAAASAIDAVYLGAQASDPTVDNNGDAVTAGDWYFNTANNETRIYNGSAWQVTAISASGFLTTSAIGSTVQAYDANTAKLDVAQTFTADQTFPTANVTTVDLGDWTVTESGGVLYFANGGTNKMKLDASGNLTVTGDVTAYGTV